jgi:hypothetical protein
MQLQLLRFHRILEKKYHRLMQNSDKVPMKFVVIFRLQIHKQGLIYLSHNIKEWDLQPSRLININYYHTFYYAENQD